MKNAGWKNTIPFTPYITSGKVIKIHDGDTITICAYFPYDRLKVPENIANSIYRWNVRLLGVDCPEITSKDEIEKNCSKRIQREMFDLLIEKNVRLENVSYDKYGRILANVILEENTGEININEWLISKRYAVRYDGGTKHKPLNWENYINTGNMF